MKEENLVEVEPVKSKKSGRTVWYYGEIDTYKISLTWKGFEDLLNEKTSSGKFRVAERDGNYIIKYFMKDKAKPSLVILKEDGRLYTFKDTWENEDMRNLARHGAGILIELLIPHRMVSNAKKRYFSWKLYPKEQFGYAPEENTPRKKALPKPPEHVIEWA